MKIGIKNGPQFAAVLMVSVSFGACQTGPKKEAAAIVNGHAISKAEFEAEVERNLARYKRGPDQALPTGIETRIKESVLRRMIDDHIIESRASKEGVAVSAEELDEKFKAYKARFRTEKAFSQYLERSKNTEEQLKKDLARNVTRDKLVATLSGESTVTDEEIKKHYDENQRRFFQKGQVKLSRIVIKVPRDASKVDKRKARKKANEVRSKAVKGDFPAVAKEFSEGPEASRGGDLGWLARGRMQPAFDNVAFTMKAGAISEPIETPLGWEIIKAWDHKEERQRPLDEVKESIRSSLIARKKNAKRREVLQELKSSAKIEQKITFEMAKSTFETVKPGHPHTADAKPSPLPVSPNKEASAEK